MVQVLQAQQNNSTGSVLTNDVTLGAGIRELKFNVTAPDVENRKIFVSKVSP